MMGSIIEQDDEVLVPNVFVGNICFSWKRLPLQ